MAPVPSVKDGLDELLEDLARNLALIAIAVGQFDIEASGGLARQADLGVDGRFT